MMSEERAENLAGHNPDRGSAFDWSWPKGNMLQTIKSTTQIYQWVLTRHDQYFAARSSDVIRGETSGMKCRLFTKALNQWPQVRVINSS